ncbi:MAG: hypothetical protein U0L91_10725 [Gemmiger sp.]|uniref:hypothetical protein n=1 Tax=Gemmiger sp. TaxID=2049027 RepID=UPI002E75AF9B|nr:hypothetical protein [Gemmiger sp.]MEE0801734.1 hypothetical protein [Gemmiger sp.]
MKQNKIDLRSALLLSLLLNPLLRSGTGYWSRAGLLTAPLCAALLFLVAVLFSAGWQRIAVRPLRIFFCAILALGSAFEILRLRRLLQMMYPGTITLLGCCFVLLLPVIYLRREPSLRQTSAAVLVLLMIGLFVLVVSVFPCLKVTNLQQGPLSWQDLSDAVRSQLVLYPEYLLPALWPQTEQRRNRSLLVLCGSAVAADAAVHVFLELFFGASMPWQTAPFQAAAQCGALSIFNRLEWMQLVLWCMIVPIKLGLYLYAMIGLSGGHTESLDTAVGLDRFPAYLAGMVLLCILFRNVDPDRLQFWETAACLGIAVPTVLGGICQCVFTSKKRSA